MSLTDWGDIVGYWAEKNKGESKLQQEKRALGKKSK